MEKIESTHASETFPKNDREVIGVGVNDCNGSAHVYIWTFRKTQNDGTLTETNKGVEIPLEKYDDLLQVLSDVGDVMISEKVVGKIELNTTDQIWVGVNKANNIPQIFFQNYTKFGETEIFEPAEQGISMRVEFYPYLLDALGKIQTPIIENEPQPVVGNPPVKCPFCEKRMKGRALHGHIKRVHADISRSKERYKNPNLQQGIRVTIDERGFVVSHKIDSDPC
jgi:hypothetical protein